MSNLVPNGLHFLYDVAETFTLQFLRKILRNVSLDPLVVVRRGKSGSSSFSPPPYSFDDSVKAKEAVGYAGGIPSLSVKVGNEGVLINVLIVESVWSEEINRHLLGRRVDFLLRYMGERCSLHNIRLQDFHRNVPPKGEVAEHRNDLFIRYGASLLGPLRPYLHLYLAEPAPPVRQHQEVYDLPVF